MEQKVQNVKKAAAVWYLVEKKKKKRKREEKESSHVPFLHAPKWCFFDVRSNMGIRVRGDAEFRHTADFLSRSGSTN